MITQLPLLEDMPAQEIAELPASLHGLPDRIRSMHRRFGSAPTGTRCRTCVHLYARQFANRYYKCDLTRETAGPGSDWRARWPACGQYERSTS